jgi:hypothetical protein
MNCRISRQSTTKRKHRTVIRESTHEIITVIITGRCTKRKAIGGHLGSRLLPEYSLIVDDLILDATRHEIIFTILVQTKEHNGGLATSLRSQSELDLA